jgi:hypothetical protein
MARVAIFPTRQVQVGSDGSGYGSLFTSGTGVKAPSGKKWGKITDPNQGFARRFGIARLYERNQNLLEVLDDPKGALQNVNNDLYGMINVKAGQYDNYINEFRALGFGEEEAISRADIMIGRELENELALLQIKRPYATGGAEAGGWDPVSAILGQSNINRAPRTFKAIESSGGLGVSSKKALKRRLRSKYGKQ